MARIRAVTSVSASEVSGVIETDSVRPGGNVERRKGIVVIDLAAVAERINALEGWDTEFISEFPGRLRLRYVDGGEATIWGSCRGTVSDYAGDWSDDLMTLLPALKIVAEARGE